MKKFLIIIFVLVMTFLLVACKNEKEINLYIVDGAPTLTVANIIKEGNVDGVKVNVKTVSSVDVLNSALLNGSADVAIMPVNSTQKLFNNGVKVKLLTVNVFGCLYVVGKNDCITLDDLRNKEINLVGKTGTPDISLRFLLNKNNIPFDGKANNGVILKYIQNDTVIPSLKAGIIEYALIGEPLVSKALEKVDDLKPIIDIKKEWEMASGGKVYTQAGVVVTDNLLDTNLKFVSALYSKLNENNNFIYNNVDNLNEIFPSSSALHSMNFTVDILDRCSLGCIRASEIEEAVKYYLETLGETFNDNFIYKGKL